MIIIVIRPNAFEISNIYLHSALLSHSLEQYYSRIQSTLTPILTKGTQAEYESKDNIALFKRKKNTYHLLH